MNKLKSSGLSGRYLAALRLHFEQGAAADLQAAHKLGAQAVEIGLETLDLARIHDQALGALILPNCSSAVQDDMALKAAIFFTEAIAPLEKTHSLALKMDADLDELKATLARHTLDLAESTLEIQGGIAQRKAAEEALEASRAESARLLNEARRMQEHLQKLAHEILSAQEDERKTMSLKLQDEIAQTLLGIQIRLLTLQKEVSVSGEDFKKEIAITRRLVNNSVRTINRFAREFGIQYEN